MYRKLGVIGDVHAHHENLEIALNHLAIEGVDAVVCTGDIVDGEGDVGACVALLQEADVITVRGNHDRWVLQNKARHVPHAHRLQDLPKRVIDFLNELPLQQQLATTAGALLLCHGVAHRDLHKVWPGTPRMHAERSAELDELIEQNTINWVINGHMHYRILIHFEALTLINAGTVRNGHHPGFSVLDLTQQEIHSHEICHASPGRTRHVKTMSLAPSPQTRIFRDTRDFDDAWEPVTLYA